MTNTENADSMFRYVETAIHEEILRQFEAGEVDENAICDFAGKSVKILLDTQPEVLAANLKKRSPSMLRDRRQKEKGFRNRNFKRWRPAFNLIETRWHAAEEIGREFNAEYRTEAAKNEDFVFEVATRMHGRGLLVAKEAIHLLKGGFPDGALSQWRTLHEILVITVFIKKHGPPVAERYLASVEFTRHKAAIQLNAYADRSNLQKISDDDIIEIERRKDAMEAKFGKDMREEYGWARPAFAHFKETRKVKFSDIEEDVELDHWRPRYKWASQHVHAGMRDMNSLLAQSEVSKPLILVGESNSGFVEPLQMTALHISSLTVMLLLTKPNIDALIMVQSIDIIAKEVADIAIARERRTLADARQSKWRCLIRLLPYKN